MTAQPVQHYPTPRILIADPDDRERTFYRFSFVEAGCDVVEAADGREAMEKAFTRVPFLVITELSLPLVDGYALCEILRADRTTSDVPILVVTAEDAPEARLRAWSAGADAVLTKPASRGDPPRDAAIDRTRQGASTPVGRYVSGGRRTTAPIGGLDRPVREESAQDSSESNSGRSDGVCQANAARAALSVVLAAPDVRGKHGRRPAPRSTQSFHVLEWLRCFRVSMSIEGNHPCRLSVPIRRRSRGDGGRLARWSQARDGALPPIGQRFRTARC